jgi:hypothetical protein
MSDIENNYNATENGNISILSNDTLIQLSQMAEDRVKAMNTIKLHALKATNKNDWVNEGGKPYLQESGSCKIARVFGVSYRINPPTKQLFSDGHYEYIYTGDFSLGGAEISATGSRSSKGDFFVGKKDPKPVSEIDEGDVRKAAYTNCIGRGIKELLGLGNLTWDELGTAGIKKNECAGFEFDKSKQEMSSEAKDQRKEIAKMLLEMADNDKETASKLLAEFTAFTGRDGKEIAGKSKLEDLSEKAIPVTYSKIKKAHDEWRGPDGSSGNSPENT